MEGGQMKAKDQIKLETIFKIEKGKLSRRDGEILLGVSERTLRRFLENYRQKNIGFLRQGNAMRKPLNKHPEALKDDIQRLMKEKYYDFNMSHARKNSKKSLV